MTNEPDSPESDGPQDPSSSVDPVDGSTASERDDSVSNDADDPTDLFVSGASDGSGENLDDDVDWAGLTDVDDLFGSPEDTTADTVDFGRQSDLDAEHSIEEPGDSDLGDVDDLDAEPEVAGTDHGAGFDTSESVNMSPPIAGPVPVARQLTRDPYTSFGGVASGLSHHFGIDVSIIRIAFVALTLFSGIGLVLYFVGWIVIPRARFWPPVPRAQASAGVSGRELGFVLAGLGLLILWFGLGGIGAQIFVPLLLIAGGVWFLSQPDRRLMTESSAGAARVATPPMPVAPHQPVAAASPAGGTSSTFATNGPEAGTLPQTAHYPAPVPPRSRFRRILKPLAIMGIFILPVLIIIGFVGAILAIAAAEGEFDTTVVEVSTDGVREVVDGVTIPRSFNDIPAEISSQSGDLTLDLTEIDLDSFDGEPIPVEINNDFGSVEVIVPDDMNVDVQADVKAGDIQIFEREADGLGVSMSVGQDNPMVELDISVDFGEITVDTD